MQIAICDDEREIRNMLGEKLKRMYPDSGVSFYDSGDELLLSDSQPPTSGRNCNGLKDCKIIL